MTKFGRKLEIWTKLWTNLGDSGQTKNDILDKIFPCRCWLHSTSPQIRRVSRRQYCALYKFIYLQN